jgi:hypothetical protein
MILITAGILLWVAGGALILYSNALAERLVDEVNAHSPNGHRITHEFLQLKFAEVLARHRVLFPDSVKRRRMETTQWTGFGLFIAGALLFVLGSLG